MSIFKRFAPVFILLLLAPVCLYQFFVWFWRDNALPAEKQIARNIELASFGPDRINTKVDYCIPRLGLPVCSAELIENEAPGTPCYMQKCSWGHVTNLSLYGGQLDELTPDIAGLPGLVELDLHQNNLTRLPPEIGQLSSLSKLDLTGNQLKNLPPEISRLIKLKKLDISGNDLTSLPPEIGLLRNLTYLNLGDNPIRGPLPEFLTRLPLDELIFTKTKLCVPAWPWLAADFCPFGAEGKTPLVVLRHHAPSRLRSTCLPRAFMPSSGA